MQVMPAQQLNRTPIFNARRVGRSGSRDEPGAGTRWLPAPPPASRPSLPLASTGCAGGLDPADPYRPWLGVLAALRSHSGAGCGGPVPVTVQVQRGVHRPQSSVNVTELTGMTSKQGMPEVTKLSEVQAVLRDTLKQRFQAA